MAENLVLSFPKRIRSANYTYSEKQLLLSLIWENRAVIENKRTDQMSNKEKEVTWEKIREIFNGQCPSGYFRSTESLRKYYENVKKRTREHVAHNVEVTNSFSGKNDPTFDLTLSILNDGVKSEFVTTSDHNGNIEERSTNANNMRNPVAELLDDSGSSQKPKMRSKETIVHDIFEWANCSGHNVETPIKNHREDVLAEQCMDLVKLKRQVAELSKRTLVNKMQGEADDKEHSLKMQKLNLEILTLDRDSKRAVMNQNIIEHRLRKKSLLLDIQLKRARFSRYKQVHK